MTSLLLDTHAWVWWISRPDRLSRRQRTAIERTLKRTDAALLVSIISCWEVALLCQHGRFRFTIPVDKWLEEATVAPGVQVVPLSLPIIIAAPQDGTVKVHQDLQLYAAMLAAGQQVTHTLQPGRRAWLQVARGNVTLNGQAPHQSDGAAVTQESSLEIASPGKAELLLFDLA